jgi:nitroimidazol reductase NimA-like FMN-containing flavoprotein (pyridoxamine 5'-phosphate oxidase superfamily)
MATPFTALDEQYSDPTATVIGWKETVAALETAELFWISTVRGDGRPHVTPVVAVWAEGAVWFGTGSVEQKFANLRTNPHVVLTTGPFSATAHRFRRDGQDASLG